MPEKIKKLLQLTKLAKKQSVSMQNKLMLYWFSMVAAIFAVLLLILSISGVFSNTDHELEQALDIQLKNVEGSIAAQMDTLAAQSLMLSEKATRQIIEKLPDRTGSFEQLNNRPELLLELQRTLYSTLNTTLQVCDCSGAFLVLDATTNTKSDIASSSRTGLYLRFFNLSSKKSAQKEVVYFRGIPDIAREEKLELHNRWNLEFNIDRLPGYRALMDSPVNRLGDSYWCTEKFRLHDTWEDVILLCMPVLDGAGKPSGVCGVEISTLYFNFSYPCIQSQFGSMISVIAPVENGRLKLSSGLVGGIQEAYLDDFEDLTIHKGKYYNTYTTDSATYVGFQQSLALPLIDGQPWAAAILVPQSSYLEFAAAKKAVWIWSSLGFLGAMLILSVVLSRKFVKPIAESLAAISSEAPLPAGGSGICEIENLIAFIRSKEQSQKLAKEALPPDIAELFDDFAARIHTLTPAELGILKYYINGHEISEIPDLAFISIKTVRKHNSNIYEKLNVASRDELMLYIDLFRRCGRIKDLENSPANQQS